MLLNQRRVTQHFVSSLLALTNALTTKNVERIKYSINRCLKFKYTSGIHSKLRQAQALVDSQWRIEKLSRAVFAGEQEIFAEIRRYQHPTPLVQQIVSAVLLLLGEHEGKTKVCGNKFKLYPRARLHCAALVVHLTGT